MAVQIAKQLLVPMHQKKGPLPAWPAAKLLLLLLLVKLRLVNLGIGGAFGELHSQCFATQDKP